VPRVWFLLDELATLQRLPQLHTAVTEARWRKGLKDCLPLAFICTRELKSMLFGVEPQDPITAVACLVVLLLAGSWPVTCPPGEPQCGNLSPRYETK